MAAEVKSPEYSPGEIFWMLISKKAVKCEIGSVLSEWTRSQYIIRYHAYFNLKDIGVVVNGMPERREIVVVENQRDNKMYRTKEELLASL